MRIFVGEGSRYPSEKCYECAAEAIGEFIVSKGCEFVFGGCNSGLMGLTYRKVVENPDCKITAIVDKAYERDLVQLDFHTGHVTESLCQRKDYILRLSDVMVFLPGGIGTIDELMSALETKRTGEYKGQIVIVNINGFYDGLIRQISFARWQGLSNDIDQYCRIFPNMREALLHLETIV